MDCKDNKIFRFCQEKATTFLLRPPFPPPIPFRNTGLHRQSSFKHPDSRPQKPLLPSSSLHHYNNSSPKTSSICSHHVTSPAHHVARSTNGSGIKPTDKPSYPLGIEKSGIDHHTQPIPDFQIQDRITLLASPAKPAHWPSPRCWLHYRYG